MAITLTIDGKTIQDGQVNITTQPVPPTPEPQKYTLTINPSTGGSVTLNPAGGSYPQGAKVILTAIPSQGYTHHVSGWSGLNAGETPAGNSVTITMNANRVVQANFSQSAPPPVGNLLAWNKDNNLNLRTGEKLNYILRVTKNSKRIKMFLIANATSTVVSFIFTFPDGRQFKGKVNYTSGAPLDLRSQQDPYPDIPDEYIFPGDYLLSLEVVSGGLFMLTPYLY
jgi:hypothetical protein